MRHHLKIACGYTFEEAVHGDWIDALQGRVEPLNEHQEKYRGLREIVAAIFRGGWKSTLVAGYVTWRIARDRNYRAQLLGATHIPSAERVNRARHLLMLPRMTAIYGPFASKDDWNQTAFTVHGRTEIFAEPTYSAQGRESFKPGGHFDDLILDDFEDQDTTNTRDLIEDGRRIESLAYPMNDRPRALMMSVGTFWDDADVLNHKINKYRLFQEVEDESGVKHKRVRHLSMSPDQSAVLFYRPAENEDGSPSAPNILDGPKLEHIRTYEMSAADYAAQYLLDPIAHDDAAFKKEDFTYVSILPPGETNTYYGYDFAQSVRARADRTGIVGGKMASDYVLYVFEGMNYRLDVLGMWDAIFTRDRAQEGAIHAVEADNFVKGWKPAFEEECRKRGHYPIVEWIDSGARTKKDDRILSLQGLFHSKGVRFTNGCQPLEAELLRFPKGERKDIADAFANILHVLVRARGDSYAKEKKNPLYRAGRLVEHAHDDPFAEDRPTRMQPFRGKRGDRLSWKQC